jgi:hypothetical protein
MGGKCEIRSGIVDDFIDGRDQLSAAYGWIESGDEQTVVAARLASGNGSGRIAANSIGDQPLARFGCRKIATDLAAKLNFGLFRHQPLLDG